jgi:hypothetical protein
MKNQVRYYLGCHGPSFVTSAGGSIVLSILFGWTFVAVPTWIYAVLMWATGSLCGAAFLNLAFAVAARQNLRKLGYDPDYNGALAGDPDGGGLNGGDGSEWGDLS